MNKWVKAAAVGSILVITHLGAGAFGLYFCELFRSMSR